MKISRRLIVKGEVQGVSYRKHTRRLARNFGVTGWVRNLPDGSVEAFLEGEAAAVEALLAWCAIGPRRGRVEELTVEQERYQGLHRDFLIRFDESLAA
jgi:acylphosphatase